VSSVAIAGFFSESRLRLLDSFMPYRNEGMSEGWQTPLRQSACRRCSAIRIGPLPAHRRSEHVRIVSARKSSSQQMAPDCHTVAAAR
jgi:hypothetical protein